MQIAQNDSQHHTIIAAFTPLSLYRLHVHFTIGSTNLLVHFTIESTNLLVISLGRVIAVPMTAAKAFSANTF